jgi:hypothetical protein
MHQVVITLANYRHSMNAVVKGGDLLPPPVYISAISFSTVDTPGQAKAKQPLREFHPSVNVLPISQHI